MRVLIILCLVSCASCSTVRFNERERLQLYDMQFDPDPLQAKITNDVLTPREGAINAFSSGGGGCGCY